MDESVEEEVSRLLQSDKTQGRKHVNLRGVSKTLKNILNVTLKRRKLKYFRNVCGHILKNSRGLARKEKSKLFAGLG